MDIKEIISHLKDCAVEDTCIDYKDINCEGCERRQVLKNAISLLKQVDSGELVKKKYGEWLDKGSLSCRCSNCGCKSDKEYDYCPNCGADMRGDKNA